MKKKLLFILLGLILNKAFAQLTIYSNYNLQGTSGTCVARTIYTGANIPNGLNDQIKSISLNQGFMATIAENEDGTGERFTYMANKSNIQVNLAFVLQNKVSFIRVLKLPTTPIKKKGSGGTNNDEVIALNVSWFYDWGSNDVSTPTREFVPMAWGTGGASNTNVNNVIAKDSLTHYLAFNEPDHKGQSNIFVINALPLYKNLLRAGKRMGSPACTESQYRVWLDSFTVEAYKQNMTYDYVSIHWYDWGNYTSTQNENPNPTDVFNRFKSHIDAVYDYYKKPIWITEFNANINRPSSVHEAFMRLALPWLDANPNVERYAYFFGNDIPARNNGVLSPAGKIYSDHVSVNAYAENIYDTRPAFPFTLASWEPSTFTQGGRNVGSFAPTMLHANMSAPLAISRGSGLDLPFTTSSNGYWGATDYSISQSAETAISENKFLRFSLKSTSGKSVNYHSIEKFNIRINNIGPIKCKVEYQLNSGAFYDVALLSGPTRTTGNYVLGPVDLSKIAGLQDVPASSTITFRIIPFDASATGGSFLIGSGTADTDPDLVITGGYSDQNLSVLPVILSNFQLKRNGNNNLLEWKTNSEINFSHFILERSTNGNLYQPIATIATNGFATGSNYVYEDAQFVSTLKNYYRLKMVDKDGSFSYSRTLVQESSSKRLFNIYPTITSANSITLSYNQIEKATTIKIIGMDGKLYFSQQAKGNSGTEQIDISNLKAGTYIFLIQDSQGVETAKFIRN
ncbi:MAG: glycosyl hydrolase [Chitinophagaceae bacterium]